MELELELETVLKKLRYKEGIAATVLNAPEGYGLGIGETGVMSCDFLLLYVQDSAQLSEWLNQAIARLKEDAIFWISYPKPVSKIKTDLNRDSLWARVNGASGYRAVSNVAIDEEWSALRFRLEQKVKGKKKP